MSKPRTSGAGNKLSTALSKFADHPNKNSQNLSKFALKALRETFGESLKVTSKSDFKDTIISQSVTFSVTNGKFEEILAETALTATIQSLEKLNEQSIPSRTLHNLATLEALMLMGFDIEDPSSENTSSQVALEKPKAPEQPKEFPQELPIANPKEQIAATKEPVSNTEDLEHVTDTDNSQSEAQITTTSENNTQPVSRTDELNALIDAQSDDSEDLKLVSTTIKERIIEKMRELDLSEKAILSRLRNSSAKSIHDMTQDEGYRITGWLSKSKADSVSIKKKRDTFGGFDQHLPKDEKKNQSTKSEAPVIAPESNSSQTPPHAEASQEEPSEVATGSSDVEAGEISEVVAKTLSAYNREASSNEKAKGFAISLIKEIAGKDITEEEIVASISALKDSEAKKFRTRLSTLILTGS
ncbi:hypothetical protein QX249_09415 [Vibrio parahaemolyticus]|uniref:Uncharacterized protein n=1 Tax=Vibrio parahaemolyticus TaxID=670 RepID=A0AAW8Q318_VIBPH|nr:hypothetical protein [Vibrio parahaemolyticus]EGR2229475.1 hypothetical protein [Vibrio parahaemolyticus]MDS1820873.1 hypothetical protein [Vibrio parahaemolyticus]